MKIAVLSSLAQETGSWLRTQYIADSLRNAGKGKIEVEAVKPLKKSLPLMMDMALSIPLNFLKILFNKSDVFIAVKPFPNLSVPLVAKKMLDKSKIIVDIDDLDSGYRKGLLSEINAFSQKPFPRYFDIVTYHNSLLYDYIQKEFKVQKEKLYKLDQGVDFRIFDYKIKDENLRKKFADKNEKIILFMGHLNIASDLDEIIKAMKIVQEKLSKTRTKFVFLVAGGGPDEENFKNLAEELGVKAIFTGYVNKEDIAKYVSIADLCIVYYKDKNVNYYRCSMKLRECMGMGKKIVCDDVGDLKQFSKYTYQTKADMNEFAEKIIKLLKSKGDGRELKARKFIEKNLDWNKLGEKFLEKINSLY